MPSFTTVFATAKEVDGRAGCDLDIGDYEAGMVGWHHVMDYIWEGAPSRVEEPEEEAAAEDQESQVGQRTGLQGY